MTDDNDTSSQQDLTKEVGALETQFNAYREAVAGSDRTRRVLAVTLLCIFVVFLAATYLQFRSSFSQQKLQDAMTQEMPDLVPRLSEELVRVSQAVAPVYAEEAKRQFAEIAPKMEESLNSELELFQKRSAELVSTRFQAAVDRAAQRATEDLRKNFPGLSDKQTQELLASELKPKLDEMTLRLAQHFLEQYMQQVSAIQKTMRDFERLPLTIRDDVELERYFLHMWLQLLDHELMRAAGTKDVNAEGK